MEEQQAVKAVIVRDGKFLVIKQVVEGRTFYGLPGGRTESDDLENEVKREVLEETGLEVTVNRHVGDWSFIRESNDVKTVIHTYLCQITGGELSDHGSEEEEQIEEYLWLTPKNFVEGDYTDNESLKDLIKGIDLP